MERKYRTGKVTEAGIESQKVIQIPVAVTEQIGIRNGEDGSKIPIINTLQFTVTIPTASLPAGDKKDYLKKEIKKAYLQFSINQDKYKELDNLEFTESYEPLISKNSRT